MLRVVSSAAAVAALLTTVQSRVRRRTMWCPWELSCCRKARDLWTGDTEDLPRRELVSIRPQRPRTRALACESGAGLWLVAAPTGAKSVQLPTRVEAARFSDLVARFSDLAQPVDRGKVLP